MSPGQIPHLKDGSHVFAETSHLEGGPHVTAVTSRRLACDGAIVALLEDRKGIPLSIGRKSRTIPPGMRRALTARDGGCRVPGCTHTKFVDGHHIRHWADGGETSLDNLVLLCRHHHRLVHEGGFGCEKTASGEASSTVCSHRKRSLAGRPAENRRRASNPLIRPCRADPIGAGKEVDLDRKASRLDAGDKVLNATSC